MLRDREKGIRGEGEMRKEEGEGEGEGRREGGRERGREGEREGVMEGGREGWRGRQGGLVTMLGHYTQKRSKHRR